MFQRNYHTPTIFSQFFLIVSGVSFVFSFFKPDLIKELFSVIPWRLYPGYEVWRLLTFPFSSGNLESFILLTLCVGLFLPIVETTIATKRLFLSVILLFITQGLMYTIAFHSNTNNTVLMGADSMSFFAMGMYTFLQPHRPISLWKNMEIKGMFLVVLLATISFLYSGLRSAQSPELFYYCAINSAFGVLFAVITTFTYQKTWRILHFRRHQINPLRNSDELFQHQEEFVSSDGQVREFPITYSSTTVHLSDEEMLDQILDKIYEHGQDSLTPEEKQFLDEYSQRMR